MSLSLFHPFETLYFDDNVCFLTGEDLPADNEKAGVFPDWILDRFALHDQKFKMIDNVTAVRYSELKLPCSQQVKTAFELLDTQVKEAIDKGSEAVRSLPERQLFLWMGKMVYGVLYHDLVRAISRSMKRPNGKSFELSPYLKQRLSKFHLMLQSLVVPMEFSGVNPWSIAIVNLRYSKDVFNYRDDPIHLNFSLGLNGLGILSCLQDNGAVKRKEGELLDKIGRKQLHPIQFEELAARFFYDNYLLKDRGKTGVEKSEEGIVIESVPVAELDASFAPWDDDMFAQLLTDYWAPWGFTKKDVIQIPDAPVSFLEDDFTHRFIEPESIDLPY